VANPQDSEQGGDESAERSQGTWKPDRDDAELIGFIGEVVRELLKSRLSVWQVFAVPDTWAHIVRRHGGQMDIWRARALLPLVLQNPRIIYIAETKPKSIVFVGKYDELHDLVVAVKNIAEKDELWLSTMHKIQNDRIGAQTPGVTILFKQQR
jgi:hypothetical protein